MDLHQTQHHSSFRQEIADPFFDLIKSGESCVVVGVAGLGKSRLLQFLLSTDTIDRYLQEDAGEILFVWVDCNRMAEVSPWGLYELLLTTLLESASNHEKTRVVCEQLIPLRSETIIERNPLLAQRNLELALRMLCNDYDITLAIILDEFDESYSTLAPQTLANLQAIRDANKYRLCYALFMRHHPSILRNPNECEGFYDLISRTVLYLKPYGHDDTLEAIRMLMLRRGIKYPGGQQQALEAIAHLSGGHPGLMVGMVAALFELQQNEEPLPTGDQWADWSHGSSKVDEECRKIWEGLSPDERQALYYLAAGTPMPLKDRTSVVAKGLILDDAEMHPTFFTPVFRNYVRHYAQIEGPALRVDTASGVVWVHGKASDELTDKEFELVEFLSTRMNMLCNNEEIIAHLWPGEQGFQIGSNTVAALVRRVRKKIEPDPSRPRFLSSIKGRGYRLVDQIEGAA